MTRSALAATGLSLLSANTLSAFTNECPYEGYNPYTEFSSDIRKQFFGNELEVKGILYDKDQNPVPDAVIEVWHLSAQSGKYRHRTKIRTNRYGEYRIQTDFPGRAEAQSARVYFKIGHDNKTRYTELAVDQTGANITSSHWEENQHLKDKLLPEANTFLNTLRITFNLSIY